MMVTYIIVQRRVKFGFVSAVTEARFYKLIKRFFTELKSEFKT